MCASSELKKSVDPGSIIPLALNSFTEASWHDFTSNGLPRAMNSLEPREKLIISSTFEGTDQSITRTFTLSRQFLFLRSLSQRHWAPQGRPGRGWLWEHLGFQRRAPGSPSGRPSGQRTWIRERELGPVAATTATDTQTLWVWAPSHLHCLRRDGEYEQEREPANLSPLWRRPRLCDEPTARATEIT